MAGKIKSNFKFWLNIITFVALAFLIVVSRHQIVSAFAKLVHLNVVWLLMMIPLQLFNYYSVARLYGDYFKSQGERIDIKTLYAVALELNFINHVFPSGGISGFSYLSIRLKREGISTAKSTLAQIIRFILTFLSFLVLLFIGMLVLALRRHTSPLTILISSSIAFLTLFGTLIGVYIISDENRIHTFSNFLPKAINSVIRPLFRSKRDFIGISRIERLMTELHNNYLIISKNYKQLKKPFLWALALNTSDIMTAYVVYLAFGSLINPGALILAYAVANFAGLIAILPGGVGIYEGLMTATLASAGVNKVLALSATVVYRVVNMAIFLPPGYYLYHQALKNGSQPPTVQKPI